jgi:hypothetical protein
MSLHGEAEDQTRTKKVVQIARRNLRQFILAQKEIDASQQQEKPHRA